MAGARGGGAQEGFYNPLLLPRPDRRPDRPVAADLHGGAVLGLRGHRAVDRDAGARAVARCARPRPTSSSLRWAPECFGDARRPQARRAVRSPSPRAAATCARPPHPRPPGRRRLGHRRPEGLHRQRRHRRRPRRRRDRRPRGRPPRPGLFIVPKRHARADAWCASSTSSAAAPRTPARSRFEDCRSRPSTCSAASAQSDRQGPRGRAGSPPAPRGGRQRACSGAAPPTLGAFERTRPMVAAQALGIARAALEFARDYASQREAFGEPIIENQGISFPLADLAADIDAARLLTWRARGWPPSACRSSTPRARCPSSRPPRSPCGSPSRRSRLCGGWGYIKRLPGREVVPRRQALHDLRGHERDPAPGDRPRAGRSRRAAAAPPRAGRGAGARAGRSGAAPRRARSSPARRCAWRPTLRRR